MLPFYSNVLNFMQVHLPSFSVFANFPSKTLDLGRVETIAFSPNSGYMAIGNNIGGARLIRLVLILSRYFYSLVNTLLFFYLGYTTSAITNRKVKIKSCFLS